MLRTPWTDQIYASMIFVSSLAESEAVEIDHNSGILKQKREPDLIWFSNGYINWRI